jgi:hypothetical protein
MSLYIGIPLVALFVALAIYSGRCSPLQGMGMSLTFDDFKRILKMPKAVIIPILIIGSHFERLVGNVVGFHLRPIVDGPTGSRQLMSMGDGLRLQGSSWTLAANGTEDALPQGVAVIEVSVTLLKQQGATLLRDGAITMGDAMERFGRTFTRRTSVLPKG